MADSHPKVTEAERADTLKKLSSFFTVLLKRPISVESLQQMDYAARRTLLQDHYKHLYVLRDENRVRFKCLAWFCDIDSSQIGRWARRRDNDTQSQQARQKTGPDTSARRHEDEQPVQKRPKNSHDQGHDQQATVAAESTSLSDDEDAQSDAAARPREVSAAAASAATHRNANVSSLAPAAAAPGPVPSGVIRRFIEFDVCGSCELVSHQHVVCNCNCHDEQIQERLTQMRDPRIGRALTFGFQIRVCHRCERLKHDTELCICNCHSTRKSRVYL